MSRGGLRIYLGAAPGVGKTYAMLHEGHRRKGRGTDVVVGFVETHGRALTAAAIDDLELVPRKTVVHRDRQFEEMDVDAVLRRRPQVALIDELAHTNVPGTGNEKRWQDVEEIREAGIDVVSTLDIRHFESIRDVVERITGVAPSETIPDAVVRAADQVELVDMSPEAIGRRLAHGNIYPPDQVDAALANYFRPGNLAALRELALLWVADRVDESLQRYMSDHGISGPWETRERVVVALRGGAEGEQLIRRASRVALRAKAELQGVHVVLGEGPPAGRAAELLSSQRDRLAELGGTYHEVIGSDLAHALVDFARAENATQLVLGASSRPHWAQLLRGSVINEVIRESGPIDVHVIGHREQEASARLPHQRGRVRLPRRRLAAGWVVGLSFPLVLTFVLAQLRNQVDLPSVLLLYLLVVASTAAVGGAPPAAVAAVGGFLLANWYFTPPFYTLSIAKTEDILALVVFLLVAGLVSALLSLATRRAAEAARAAAEAEVLARATATSVGSADPLPALVAQLRATFGQDGVAVVRKVGPGWETIVGSGEHVPGSPDEADAHLPLTVGTVLVLRGPRLPAEDRRLLSAFGAQLAVALESRRLADRAAEAVALTEGNNLRTALLAAVSHDLRTPLSSIKASVTSLLQDDVEWPPAAAREFLDTIAEETDRLNALVGNLLDMSRIQTGALQMGMREVGLDEVVPRALDSLSQKGKGVVVDVPETLPRVEADPALLERAVANIVANALAWSPPGANVCVQAGEVPGRVDLRIVDRGVGVRPEDRERIFQPFQRLGDRAKAGGVGLGLAVSRGFVEAMGGELTLEDTPGGGLTMVIRLRKAGA